MTVLTPEECSRWLAAKSIVEAPYGLPWNEPDALRPYCAQVPLPARMLTLASLFRGIAELLPAYEQVLVQIVDWAHYQPEEMAVVINLRKAHGEERWLIDAPGHLFSKEEHDLFLGLLALVTAYEWTAYVYFDRTPTLLSWEGVLLDVWSSDPAMIETIQRYHASLGESIPENAGQ